MKKKLLLLFGIFFYSFIGFSQFPGCPNVNAGVDQVLPCSQNCTNLTATPFQTGAPTSYAVSSITHSPPIAYNDAGGTAVSVDIDDVWSPPITLPFNFCYYGTNYTTINVGSNGAIQFGGGITGGTYHPWPFTASCPSAALTVAGDVFGVYHDIDPSVDGTVKWYITGTAPCRIFVVSYNNLGHFSCISLRSTHMMVLYETTNVIDVYVNNKATCTSWNGGAAIIGIQNPAGTAGITAPGRNTNPIWTVTSPEAWRFTPNGTPNYTIAWFQGINQIGTSATINVCPVGTTTYTAQVTYTMCNGTTVQETDQVNVSYSSAVPVINLTSVNETCTGVSNGTATASPSGGAPGYTYSWNTIPIQTTQTATGLSAGTYTCAVTDANGCVATQNITITANNPTISGILSVCVGATSQLTGSASPNTGTPWASSMAGVATVSSTGLVTGVTTGTTAITYMNSLGCTTTASVTITAPPTATIIYENSPYCKTETTAQSVTQTGVTGGAYTASPIGLSINASSGAITPSSSNVGSYTVSYTLAASGSCSAVSTTAIVTITAAPTASISYANSPYCKTVTTAQAVTQTGVTGGAYTASPIGLSINASTGAITPSSSNVGSYTVSYTLAASGGCAAVTTTASVTILVAPAIFLDPIACDYVYQVAGTTSAIGGVWSSSDTCVYFSDQLASNPQISTNYGGIFPVTFTDNACNQSLTEFIEFLPYIYTQVLDTNICPGSSFELSPLILNTPIDTLHSEWTLQANYTPSTTWFWENGSTEIPRIISGAGSYIFHLNNACYEVTDTATIGIKPCDISAPNIIVISSEAGNNFFSINTTGIVDFNCVILNRWGNVIYEYTDPAGGWNGKTLDGNLVEEGTYFYRIKATYEGGEDVIKHGFVVLKY